MIRNTSFALFALVVGGAVYFKLGPVVLSGLFSYMILDLTHRRLARSMNVFYARWLALAIYIVAASGLFWLFAHFVRQTLSTLPQIAAVAVPRLIVLCETYGFDLPFDNVYELREIIAQSIKSNVPTLTRVSGLLTKEFFHVVVGIFVAILCFMNQEKIELGPNLYDALRQQFAIRIKTFLLGFERVFSAQIIISCVNTAVTATFILLMGLPNAAFLTLATFIFGLLPVIGGVMSNTIIVSTALAISPGSAAFALTFLVVSHKVEYFLFSRIMGSSINAPMWQTLLGVMVGEVVMGVPGVLLAPAFIYYIKEELRQIPAELS